MSPTLLLPQTTPSPVPGLERYRLLLSRLPVRLGIGPLEAVPVSPAVFEPLDQGLAAGPPVNAARVEECQRRSGRALRQRSRSQRAGAGAGRRAGRRR